MNRTDIREEAIRRMTMIEERYADYHVPTDVSSYYRLLHMIATGIEAYIGNYGLLPINLGDANDGRHELGLGQLTPFERECVDVLEKEIEKRDVSYFGYSRLAQSQPIRLYG